MPHVELAIEELQRLTRIVASLYEFTDLGARGRREILRQAGLLRFLLRIDLTGPPHIVAGDVVGRLMDYGFLPERPTHHALGALLSYLLTLGDLPREDARFVAELILKYALVADPAYIDKLRTDYNITESDVPQPAEAGAVPLAVEAPGAISTGPSFEVAITDDAAAEGLERLIGDETNFLDIYSLFGAIYSAQAVCLIERPEGMPQGTGFLVGPDLVLTNQHVLKSEKYGQAAVARFGHMLDATGVALPGQVFPLRAGFYRSSPAGELDYALVRLQDQPLQDRLVDDEEDKLSLVDLVRLGKHRGYLPLAPRTILEHERVNIIQHPDCDPMKVVMTHNYVVEDMSETRVQYLADTMDGSSGSPVFNGKWEVVALHHSGQPYPKETPGDRIKKVLKGVTRVNEGIPIRAILKEIERFLPR